MVNAFVPPWLTVCWLVAASWSLGVRRFAIDLQHGSAVSSRLLTNCSKASLITVDPQLEVRFEGDCSSEVVRIIHLGFHQPTEHTLEFALENSTRISLVSLQVAVRASSGLAPFLREAHRVPALTLNQTLSRILNLSGDCRARLRHAPKRAPLKGLCGQDQDPHLWTACKNFGDLQSGSQEEDSLVLTVLRGESELNIGVLLNPNDQIPEIAFDANLRVRVLPRLMVAIRRNVLSSAEDDSVIFHVVQPVSSCSFVKVFCRTPVSQFSQRSLDRLEVALQCRKEFHEATITLVASSALGLSSEPFFLALSKTMSSDLSFKPLVLPRATASATLRVTSSRDAELRVVKGLLRGILNVNGWPVVTFGTNVPLEYKLQPSAGSERSVHNLISDNLVLSYCNVEFLVSILLLGPPFRPVDSTPLTVNAEQPITLSRAHFGGRPLNFGNVHFEVIGQSPDAFLLRGKSTRTFSLYEVDDLAVAFQSTNAPGNRLAKLRFATRFAASNGSLVACEVHVRSPKRDTSPPSQDDCSLRLTVPSRSSRVALEKSVLSFSDNGGKRCASEVLFVFNSGKNESRENGYFAFANGEAAKHFSQSDVNQGRVFYRAPTIFSRMNARRIAFEFYVVDTEGNSSPNFKLQVYLKAVKVAKTLHCELVLGAGVSALGSGILSPATNASSALFGIISLPSQGKIARGKNVSEVAEMRLWDHFNYSDIASQNVWYESDRNDGHGDSFELLALDQARDNLSPKRKARTREKKAKRRKFARSALHYVRIVVNVLPADQMTGTEGGKDRLKFNMTVEEGRKRSVLVAGLNFSLVEPPTNGQIFIAPDENLETLVTYVHSGSEIGPDSRPDHFVVQNRFGEAEVDVLLLPIDNSAPLIEVLNATKVREGESALVIWKVSDDDSKVFWCHVSEAPLFGQLTIRGQRVSEFNNSESGKLVYEQTKHALVEPSEDQFKLGCSDGVNFSQLKTAQVVIEGQNDELPHLAADNVTVLEGREAPVKIYLSDLDKPRVDLSLSVSRAPQHGMIAMLRADGHFEAVSEFSERNLARLLYVHDSSENFQDLFELSASDGRHSVSRTVSVRVLTVDDEPPQLVVNRGVRVEAGSSAVIDGRHLQVEDVDSSSDSIYIRIVEGPQKGALCHGPDRCNSSITSFQLDDLKLQNLVYVHRSKICCESDKFTFRITDGFNETPLHDFKVSVHLAEGPPRQPNERQHFMRLQQPSQPLLNISSLQWLKVTTSPLNGDLSFDNDMLSYAVRALLPAGTTYDSFELISKNGSVLETLKFSVEWCSVSLRQTPEIASENRLSIDLRRSGYNSAVVGVVSSSLGEFPFFIPSSADRILLPISVPERFSREIDLELRSVEGCLVDSLHEKLRTVVVPPIQSIDFELREYSVGQPKNEKLHETLFLRVIRRDTVVHRSKVDFRIVTVAGTAKEFDDFIPIDKVFTLRSEVDGMSIPVEIVGDSFMENSKFFTVLIERTHEGSHFTNSKTVVRINGARTLPAFKEYPLVFAMDPKTGDPLPHSRLLPRGASLYCATECDNINPRYTGCSGFNSSEQTRYQWSLPTESGLKSIKSRSYLMKTNRKILQSFLYLLPGSTVVCSAKIATAEGEGPEINSKPYLIGHEPSSCSGSVGSTPFSSKLRAVLSSNHSSELYFALSLILPHHDGSWPLWSTRPILIADIEKKYYASKHVCSNLLSDERYSMSELLSCGARLDEEAQEAQASVSLSLPIHVMYIVHQSSSKWHRVSLSSELRISFVYKTLVMGSSVLESQESTLAANLQIQHTSFDKTGSLVVEFETNTNFDGILAAGPENFQEAIIAVRKLNSSGSLFRLKNYRNTSKHKSRWTLASLASHPQYANNFSLIFLPCLRYGPSCKLIRDKPISLPLPLHIQSGLNSAESYLFESTLSLTRKHDWMKDLSETSNVIHEGDAVYGFVRVFNKNLPDQVLITLIQKCYICHDEPGFGLDITTGCPFKVIDAGSTFSGKFNSALASSSSEAFTSEEQEILRKRNSDAFIFDSTPLFESDKNFIQWRIHCIFDVRFTSSGDPHVRSIPEEKWQTLENSAVLRLEFEALEKPMRLHVASGHYANGIFLFSALSLILLFGCLRRKPVNYSAVPPVEIVAMDQNLESFL